MKQICAWCRKEIGEVEASIQPAHVVSHGICPDCTGNLRFQLGVPLQAYIDSVPVPVFVVNNDGVVQTANRKAYGMLNKEPVDVEQQLGGDVFECAYARLPGGCGKTIHCSGCTIRRAVLTTFETGAPQGMVPATLNQDDPDDPRAVMLTITTVKIGEMVMLRVDRMG